MIYSGVLPTCLRSTTHTSWSQPEFIFHLTQKYRPSFKSRGAISSKGLNFRHLRRLSWCSSKGTSKKLLLSPNKRRLFPSQRLPKFSIVCHRTKKWWPGWRMGSCSRSTRKVCWTKSKSGACFLKKLSKKSSMSISPDAKKCMRSMKRRLGSWKLSNYASGRCRLLGLFLRKLKTRSFSSLKKRSCPCSIRKS